MRGEELADGFPGMIPGRLLLQEGIYLGQAVGIIPARDSVASFKIMPLLL